MISGLGAHLSWTLPFGLLIMFAVLNRFDGSWEEAARDAGASPSQILLYVTVPILFPGLIAVALFGFTLSYDEFPRSLAHLGHAQHLPLEVANMTSNVTTPALYAIGTITTVISLAVIALAFWAIAVIQKRRGKRAARHLHELHPERMSHECQRRNQDRENQPRPSGPCRR